MNCYIKYDFAHLKILTWNTYICPLSFFFTSSFPTTRVPNPLPCSYIYKKIQYMVASHSFHNDSQSHLQFICTHSFILLYLHIKSTRISFDIFILFNLQVYSMGIMILIVSKDDAHNNIFKRMGILKRIIICNTWIYLTLKEGKS